MKHLLVFILGVCLVISAAHTQTWVSLNGPQIASDVRDIAVTSNGNTVYAADANYVLKSTNSGTVWAVTPQPYGNPLLVLVKPNDGNTVLAASEGEMIYSSNGGGSWSSISGLTNLTPLRLVALRTNNNIMLLGRMWGTSNKSMWESRNGGASWNASEYWNFQTHVYDFSPYPVAGQGWNSYVAACGSYGTPSGSNRYAVADQRGVWVSPDSGVHWLATRLGEHNIVSVAIAPKANPAYFHMYAVNQTSANDTVFRSTDGGTEWLPVFNNAAEFRLLRINHSTNPVAFFLATSDGVYRSTNEGNNWSKLTGFPENDVKSLAVGAGSTVFAGTATTLYKSTDNGSTWENVGDMDVSSVTAAQVGSTQYAWAVTKDNNIAARHNGTSWERRTIGTEGGSFSTENIYRHPTTDKLFAVGAEGNVARVRSSANDGDSYNAVSYTYSLRSGSRYHAITTGPTGTMYLSGGGNLSSGGTGWRNLFNSENDGATWNAITSISDSGLWIYDIAAASSSTLYAAGSNGSVYRSTNGGTNWSSVTTVGSVARSIAVNPNYPDVVYAGGSGGVKKTTNGGASWSTIRTDNVMKVMMHPSYQNSSNHVLAVGSGGAAVFETSTGSTNWTQHTGIETPIRTLGADVVGKGNIYAGTSGGVYRINPPPTIVTGVQSAPSGGHPGISWNASPEADLASAPYRVYRYYRYCVYYHPNKLCGGPVETELVAETASSSFVDDEWDIICYGCVGAERIAGYYVKVVDSGGNESDASASVEFTVGDGGPIISGQRDLPDKYTLEVNYPNPFNPSTVIQHALPEDAHVTLRVFDVLGREVTVLLNEIQTAGYKSVQFDASDLASGVYLYRLSAGFFTDVKKMIVTK